MPGAADDDGLVAHRRDVRAAGRRRAHHERDLRDPGGRHPGLVVEDPAEVVAIREDLGLERQERAARVDEVDARQPVLERDLLGPEVLLDRHRVVGAALDRGVVGHDDAGRALDPPDPGDDPGARRIVVVQAGRGQRAQLEEGRSRVEQALDPLADRQLAALPMARDRPLVAAGAAARDDGLPSPQVVDERRHRVVVRARLGRPGVEPAAQDGHAPMIGGVHRSADRPGSEPIRRPSRRASMSHRLVIRVRSLPPSWSCWRSWPAVPRRPPRRPPGALLTVETARWHVRRRTVRHDGRSSITTAGSTARRSLRTTSASCRRRSSRRSRRSSPRPTSRRSRAGRSPASVRPRSTVRRSCWSSTRPPGSSTSPAARWTSTGAIRCSWRCPRRSARSSPLPTT